MKTFSELNSQLFPDEVGVSIKTHSRDKAWAIQSRRIAHLPHPLVANHISVLPAVSLDGLLTVMAQEGTVCRLDIEFFLEKLLVSKDLVQSECLVTHSIWSTWPVFPNSCLTWTGYLLGTACSSWITHRFITVAILKSSVRRKAFFSFTCPILAGHESDQEGIFGFESAIETSQHSHRHKWRSTDYQRFLTTCNYPWTHGVFV